MTDRGPYQALLDSALADPDQGADRLAAIPASELDGLLRDLIRQRQAAALPLVTALAARAGGAARRAARRALYRLEQSGVATTPPPSSPAAPRSPERAVRAWMSGIDGSGSRAAWVVFADRYGGLELCSVIINDVAGIMEAAGGAIARKRLERELAGLRESQKLPWVEFPADEVVARIAEALALHERLGTAPPAAFARWQRRFPTHASAEHTIAAPASDPVLAEHAGELLDLPELAGWFLDPEAVQPDAMRLMEARESRLVVSDQIRAEREEAILTEAVDRELPADARNRWARRLLEMARIFDATERPRPGALARAAAAELLDHQRAPHHVPFARALARRALEIATEVSSGRLSASDVSRQPRLAS
jgi:hypothetical protein